MMTPPADLRARVLAAAAAKPSRTRPAGRRAMAIAIAGSIAFALASFEHVGGLRHSSGRPTTITWLLAGGWAIGSLLLTWLALGRGRSSLPRRPAWLVATALAAPVACFVWMHLFDGSYVEPFARVGYRCLAYTLAMAAAPLGAFMVLRRGSDPRRPSALGAAAGASAGAWAGVLVDLWCPLTNAPHSLVGHVLPIVILVGVGALVGRRMLALRTL